MNYKVFKIKYLKVNTILDYNMTDVLDKYCKQVAYKIRPNNKHFDDSKITMINGRKRYMYMQMK